ncbi:hypothetical protein [Parasedimentitalea psychrophila]|uniref:Uncharacterized protein n=1 Tax=Parasedimentitalea psychrophila TaxID=2997337 RepID=A0A9Y2L2S6_9RHOB|nr:hypothetical protein [Parasedimentitalea psychrophila]WIY27268.1 hypothetical protein QPJ95_10295 [Parasedimentitalea psychrophila]
MWIDILNAILEPQRYQANFAVFERLVALVSEGQVVVPVFYSSIFETYKMKNADRREALSRVLATISLGRVMVSPQTRRKVEMRKVLYSKLGFSLSPDRPMWFLTDRFWEAAGEAGDFPVSTEMLDVISQQPSEALFSFLNIGDEDFRNAAVDRYNEKSRELLCQIQARRERLLSVTKSMRRRTLSALTLLDTQDDLLGEAAAIGLTKKDLLNHGGAFMKDFVLKVPCSHISVELGLKLEAESALLSTHDFHDVNFMSAALPYADIVVTEKPFANRARQAGLEKMYPAKIVTSLPPLLDLI